MKKRHSLLLLVCCALALSTSAFWAPKEPTESQKNAELFWQQIRDVCTEYRLVTLNELTPFAWDKAYSFGGYTDAEEIYEAVGYEWDGAFGDLQGGDQLLVFTKDGAVVCDASVSTDDIYILVHRDVILASDPALFMVMSAEEGDWTLYEYEGNLAPGQSHYDTPQDLTGTWRCEQTLQRGGHDVEFTISLSLLREGILEGDLHFSVPDPERAAGEWWKELGSGWLPFTGAFDGVAMQCDIEEQSEDDFIELWLASGAKSFELALQDGRFVAQLDVFAEMDNEEQLDLSGEYVLSKK